MMNVTELQISMMQQMLISCHQPMIKKEKETEVKLVGDPIHICLIRNVEDFLKDADEYFCMKGKG